MQQEKIMDDIMGFFCYRISSVWK